MAIVDMHDFIVYSSWVKLPKFLQWVWLKRNRVKTSNLMNYDCHSCYCYCCLLCLTLEILKAGKV